MSGSVPVEPLLMGLWVGTFLLALGGVAAVERWARARAILDVPNDRSSHAHPTPRGGGLALVLAVALGWAVLALRGGTPTPWTLWAAFGLVAAVSWADDLRGLGTGARFLAHAAAAGLLVWGVGWWGEVAVPGGGAVPLGPIGAVLAVVWVVGLTNAYNFMDGIDGIAGGQAVVAGAGWGMVGALVGSTWAVATGGLVVAAGAAFLLFNWSPARLFMGDVGSAPLGFLFAALPLAAASEGGASGALPLVGLLLVWPFVFDAAFTFVRRALRRENVLAAHRSHLYQRLTQSGWSHRSVATLYVALAATGVLAALGWLGGQGWGVGGVGLLAACMPIGVRAVEQRHAQRNAAGGRPGMIVGRTAE